MSRTEKSRLEPKKLWRSLDEGGRNIVFYLVHTISPVSIDTLSNLSGAPALQVLNVMEGLKKGKVVCEKKDYGKGMYFLNGTDLASFMQKEMPGEKTQEAMKKIIEFYTQSLHEGEEKTLALGELYRKGEDVGEGLAFIRNAADILFNTGQKEKALAYYDYLVNYFAKNKVTDVNAEDFIDGVLGKIALSKHLMPIHEQVSLLTRAEKTAKRFKKWDFMSKIKLALGQELQAAGQDKKAFHYINDFWKLAERIGNPRMLKIATLLTCEFLHWKGKFAEVVRRYEDVVEDLEEFGDDEATLKAGARVGLCYVRCGRIARGMGMIDTVRVKANLLNLQQVTNFADLMTILSLFEIRKIPEAEFYLNRLSALPEEIVGHYILWPVEACKAYILCMNEDYAKAFEYLKKAVEHSRFVGWMHQNGAWNFEYLDILESKGFLYDECSSGMIST
jgi:tetratricopeptide (TPR) repeat protein